MVFRLFIVFFVFLVAFVFDFFEILVIFRLFRFFLAETRDFLRVIRVFAHFPDDLWRFSPAEDLAEVEILKEKREFIRK